MPPIAVHVGPEAGWPYTRLKVLGEGSFSVVYDVGAGKALKVLRDPVHSFAELASIPEVAVTRALGPHKNVLAVEGIAWDPLTKATALLLPRSDYDLHKLLKGRSRPLNPWLRKVYAWQLLHGVARLHEAGLMHRDLKPANILVEASFDLDEGLLISDLGSTRPVMQGHSGSGSGSGGGGGSSGRKQGVMATPPRPPSASSSSSSTSLCRMVDIEEATTASPAACFLRSKDALLTTYITTRWYRAPEVLLLPPKDPHAAYGTAVDLWAVGCILVELATLLPAFPGKSVTHQLLLIEQVLGPRPLLLPPHRRARYLAGGGASSITGSGASSRRPSLASTVASTATAASIGAASETGTSALSVLSATTSSSGASGGAGAMPAPAAAGPTLLFTGARASRTTCVAALRRHFSALDREPQLLDLVSRLLCWDPSSRPTACDALTHPYFDEVRAAAALAARQEEAENTGVGVTPQVTAAVSAAAEAAKPNKPVPLAAAASSALLVARPCTATSSLPAHHRPISTRLTSVAPAAVPSATRFDLSLKPDPRQAVRGGAAPVKATASLLTTAAAVRPTTAPKLLPPPPPVTFTSSVSSRFTSVIPPQPPPPPKPAATSSTAPFLEARPRPLHAMLKAGGGGAQTQTPQLPPPVVVEASMLKKPVSQPVVGPVVSQLRALGAPSPPRPATAPPLPAANKLPVAMASSSSSAGMARFSETQRIIAALALSMTAPPPPPPPGRPAPPPQPGTTHPTTK